MTDGIVPREMTRQSSATSSRQRNAAPVSRRSAHRFDTFCPGSRSTRRLEPGLRRGFRRRGSPADVEISRKHCSLSLTSGNIFSMIRGDFGVVGVVLVVSACSSRAADLAASEGGVRERGHTAADAMATGEAVSSEQTVESLDRPASSGPGDRDPTREVPATSDHASDAGATTQSGGDEPTASGDAGAFENLFEVSAHLANEEDPHAPTTVGIVTWSTRQRGRRAPRRSSLVSPRITARLPPSI
jgi:hypothetical protein